MLTFHSDSLDKCIYLLHLYVFGLCLYKGGKAPSMCASHLGMLGGHVSSQ